MGINKTTGTLIAVTLVLLALLQLVPPIAQDLDYHQFADQRVVWGIPHFWNVISNLPFIVLGIMGMVSVAFNRTPGYLPGLKPLYLVFFAGIFFTGLTSAYYHLNPTNQTLVWDRSALSVVIMAVFAAICGEHISERIGRILLWPAVCIGLASVIYWHVTESLGHGDLRFYALVQFLPLVLLPLIMLLHESRLSGVAYVWVLLLAYVLAKASEILDGPIYRTLNGFSGHEIKHWVAAMGVFIYYLAGFRRTRRSG